MIDNRRTFLKSLLAAPLAAVVPMPACVPAERKRIIALYVNGQLVGKVLADALQNRMDEDALTIFQRYG